MMAKTQPPAAKSNADGASQDLLLTLLDQIEGLLGDVREAVIQNGEEEESPQHG